MHIPKNRIREDLNLKRLAAIPALIIFFALALLALSPSYASQGAVKITILHLNDTHGHVLPSVEKSAGDKKQIGGAAYFAEMIKKERAANPSGTLLLSAGDMYQGTPISNLLRGRPVIDIMNYLKFDAMVLGNHEFDWGQDTLRKIISSSAFPVLSANIKTDKGKYFSSVKPSLLTRRKNIPIGIIGVTTTEAGYTSKPGNLAGLTISPPEEVVPPLIRDLRARGAALIIVLSHIGVDEDRKLANAVPGIDIIVGGHTHTAVTDPIVESGTIIVQAGSYGKYLGVLDVLFDPAKKKIVDFTRKNELKLVSAGPEAKADAGAARIVAKYESQVKVEFSKVVGTTSVDITKQDRAESNLGNLITDAMRSASGAQIALQNGGSIRANILKGPITTEQVFTVLPFDNILVTMDLTGGQIEEILEHSLAQDRYMQISGLKVEYDLSKPEGSRLVSVLMDGKPLDPSATYHVATNDFLSAGGDRFSQFLQGRNTVFGPDLREVVADYLRAGSPVAPRVEGRITIKQ